MRKSRLNFKTELMCVVLLNALLTTCCSGKNGDDLGQDLVTTFLSESGHFSFVLYNGLSKKNAEQVESKLEDNYLRVLSDLEVTSLNPVKVKIWNDETDFLDEMHNDLGIRYPGASGYVFGKGEIRLLFRGNTPQTALHEFCHAVSLEVNNRFGNNPRWFWEAVAIYEAGEFYDPTTRSYLINGSFPTIEELNSNFNTGNARIYEVGFLLSEYIIHDFGKTAYINLIKSNADLELTLGTTTSQFEAGWKTFVRSKYF